MARYQIPPDPRKQDDDRSGKRPRRQRRDSREPIPWFWLGMGVLVTALAIALAFFLANSFLSRPPLTANPVEPTFIVLTAPPSLTPTATAVLPTATPIPTFTPIPTPDVAVAPNQLTIGSYAQVANTDGLGVTIRGGPSINNVVITGASEGTVLLVLDGPTESDGFLWWQVQIDEEIEGWAAGDFLIPAPAPDDSE